MLKIWLPLDESLENKGVSNLSTFSYNNFTQQTNGKIGKCYSGQGIYHLDEELIQNTWSLCAWVKSSAWSQYNDIILCKNTTASDNCQFYFSIINGATLNLGVNAGSGSVSVGYTFATNTWYHVTATYDGTKYALYINGEQKKTGTLSTTLKTGMNNLGINCRSTNAAGTAQTGDGGKWLNDVRIYDHCLSAAEVKEIAQGLVLHYKLDSPYSESSQNLCTAVRPGTAANATWGGHVTQWTNYDATNDPVPFNEGTKGEIVYGQNGSTGGGASRSICRIAASPSTAYTYSCYIKASDNLAYTHANFLYKYEYTAASGGTTITEAGYFNNARKELLSNGWYRIWGTFTTRDTTNGINISFYTYPGKNVTYWLGGWQIEQKDHVTPFMSPGTSRTGYIQDSSGYGHNGTINSMPTIFSETARYSTSTFFDGVDDCIIVPYNTICPENIFTFNLWFKKDALGSKNYETLFGGPSGFEMDTRAGSATSLSLYMAGARSSNRNTVTPMSLGNWYMITMTRDGTKEKYYVNGIYQSEINAVSMPTGTYRIGAWSSNTSQNYYGLISDFRIYCTALSADDILALYHTGAKVDNLGNLHTFEFNENGSNKLTKTGILKNYVVEPFLTLADGSKWQLMLYHYVDGGNNLFTSSNATFCNNFGLYSRLAYINNFTYDSKYEFYVLQDDKQFRWTQTSQPTASSIAGLTTVSGYTNPVNGLAKASQSNTYIGYSSWWGACGCWTSYSTGGKTGIPGFGSHDANGICTTYLALYARVNNFNAKIANLSSYANNLIEL